MPTLSTTYAVSNMRLVEQPYLPVLGLYCHTSRSAHGVAIFLVKVNHAPGEAHEIQR